MGIPAALIGINGLGDINLAPAQHQNIHHENGLT